MGLRAQGGLSTYQPQPRGRAGGVSMAELGYGASSPAGSTVGAGIRRLCQGTGLAGAAMNS